MRHSNTLRIAAFAAAIAASPLAMSADYMGEHFWRAQPDTTAWVTSYGECWQSLHGPDTLEPCYAAPQAAPLVLRLLFELDKYGLNDIRNPEALAELDDYITKLQDTPQEEKVTIVGHTDKLGSWEHNVVLSENRAQTIYDYMVSRGYPAQNITSVRGVSWEGGDDVAADGTIIDLGPLENNPLRRRVVVSDAGS